MLKSHLKMINNRQQFREKILIPVSQDFFLVFMNPFLVICELGIEPEIFVVYLLKLCCQPFFFINRNLLCTRTFRHFMCFLFGAGIIFVAVLILHENTLLSC